jgi:hypothetical protein
MDLRTRIKRIHYTFFDTFFRVDAQGNFVLICDYTGKEVVE